MPKQSQPRSSLLITTFLRTGKKADSTQQKLDDGWPASEEEQVRKFQIRRGCHEDSAEKNVKDDEHEKRADVRHVGVRRADERCVDVRRAHARCEDARRADVRCVGVRRAEVSRYKMSTHRADVR